MISLLLALIYLSFISLGLPDSLLGSAWPTMYTELGVPLSFAGIISVIISLGTIISSLQSDRLTYRFGPGQVTAFSVGMTAAALFGFSVSHSFPALCLWAIPYGLGAGSVDAALNNYVALHYESRHMSWLHCMWGVGASLGPSIMGMALSSGHPWNTGYFRISLLQIGLSLILFLSLPLWKNRREAGAEGSRKPIPLKEVLRIPGALWVLLCFFFYSGLEMTAGLWAGSFLHLNRGLSAEQAAGFASLFYLGMTAGRAFSGFLTLHFSDTQMIRMGQTVLLLGLLVLLLPGPALFCLTGILLVGLGCAPIYPCIIHSTPAHFGADRSQALIGAQMAFAYTGSLLLPPVFGWLTGHFGTGLWPWVMLLLLIPMILLHEALVKRTE